MTHSIHASDPEETESLIVRRRKFIRSRIEMDGKVTQDEVSKWLVRHKQSWSLKAMRKDIAFIESYEDLAIFELKDTKGSLEWVDDSRKFSATREDRLRWNYAEKKSIAELTAALITGFNRFHLNRGLNGTSAFVQKLEAAVKAIKFLQESYADCDLLEKLHGFWDEGQRRIFLDSGTSAQILGTEYIEFFRLPMHGFLPDGSDENFSNEKCLNKLEVITNDREVFYHLGKPNVHAKTIIVGGRQQLRSSTISGLMAQKFLEVNSIKAGMAIVSTTAICLKTKPLQQSFIAAETEHVASIKGYFLQNADIKIVIADSGKFRFTGGHTEVPVCCMNPREVDLVITDAASDEVVEHFKQLQVPLLVAS